MHPEPRGMGRVCAVCSQMFECEHRQQNLKQLQYTGEEKERISELIKHISRFLGFKADRQILIGFFLYIIGVTAKTLYPMLLT